MTGTRSLRLLAATAIGAALLGACGVDQSTPESTAEAFFQAAVEGDCDRLFDLLQDAKAEDKKACEEDETSSGLAGAKLVSIAKAQIVGSEATVEITYKFQGSEQSLPIVLEKDGDKWVVTFGL